MKSVLRHAFGNEGFPREGRGEQPRPRTNLRRRSAVARAATGSSLGFSLLAVAACHSPAPCSDGFFEQRDGAVIESPEDLEAFTGSCILVHGTLRITGNRITDLDALDGVVALHGTLRLESPSLGSTAGLSALEYVQGDVIVVDAPSLERVEMPHLRAIGGSLRFGRLPRLLDLDGTPDLVEIGDSMRLVELDAIAELDLPPVTVVGGDLVIANNGQLEVLRESGSLFEIGDGLLVRGNPRLTRVEGFDGLDRVGSRVEIIDNSRAGYDAWPVSEDEAERPPRPQPFTIQSISVRANEALREVVGFNAPHTAADGFGIAVSTNPRLEAFDAFTGIGSAAPVDAGRLHPETWATLGFHDNPELRRLPTFREFAPSSVTFHGILTLSGNDQLETLAGLQGVPFDEIYISRNAALRSLEGLTLIRAYTFVVRDNDALTSFDGVFIEPTTDEYGLSVHVSENDSLTDIMSLARVPGFRAYYVYIEHNHTLSQAQAAWFGAIAGEMSSKIAGNQGWSPADPCPYTEDERCDEVLVDGIRICQLGSDEVDCAG